MSGSALPYKRTPPSWLKTTSVEVRGKPGWRFPTLHAVRSRAAVRMPARVQTPACSAACVTSRSTVAQHRRGAAAGAARAPQAWRLRQV